MPTWPAYLPAPEKDSIQLSSPRGIIIRTPFENGPAATRRRFTAAPHYLLFSCAPVSEGNAALFMAFFLDAAGQSFTMTHPVTGQVVNCRFMGDDAYGLQDIGAMPTGEDSYRLSVSLEVLP